MPLPLSTVFYAVSKTISALAVTLGAVVLVGWALDLDILKSVVPVWVSMKANTATAFVLGGISLWLLNKESPSTGRRAIAQTCAAIVALVGFLTLGEYLVGWNLGIDQLLFQDAAQVHTSHPGRMAPPTAVNFLFLGTALIFLDRNRWARFVQALTLFVVLTGFLTFTGYLFGVQVLYGIANYTYMAIHTAVAFLALGLGVLFARPERGLMALLTRDSAGGVLARRLLPAAFAIPVGLGWLRLAGQQAGFYDTEVGVSLTVLNTIILFVVLILWISASLHHMDLERRQATAAAKMQAEELDHFFNLSLDLLCIADTAGYFRRMNPQWEATLGYRTEEMVGREFLSFVHPDDIPATVAAVQDLRAGKTVINFVNRYRAKDGGYRLLEWQSTPYQKQLIFAAARDITLQKQAEETLRKAAIRFRRILETAPDGIVLVDEQGVIRIVNEKITELTGYAPEQLLGQAVEILVPARVAGIHRQHRDGYIQKPTQRPMGIGMELLCRRRDGREFPVEISLSPLDTEEGRLIAAVVRDITDRKRAEVKLQEKNTLLEQAIRAEQEAHEALKKAQEQLIQTEKLVSLGQLVAGVAHEINNPLSFVSNNAVVLQRDLATVVQLLNLYRTADPVLAAQCPEVFCRIQELGARVDMTYTLDNLSELLVRSRDGLHRIQQIVQDLRDFARHETAAPQATDLNVGLQSTVNILRGQARKKQVQIDLELGPLPPVYCFPAKINQVLMNLLANALDACPEGGRITVRTRPEGSAVLLEVEDTGAGIDPAIRSKIFDPFFTTKPQGAGTGLGLSISYGIVRDHGGTIGVDSKPGQGARFTVRLPLDMRKAKA